MLSEKVQALRKQVRQEVVSVKDCPLCGIARGGGVGETIVYEDDKVIAIESNRPIAPVHLIVFPRTHVESMMELVTSGVLTVMLEVLKLFVAKYGTRERRFGFFCGTCPAHPHLHLQLQGTIDEGVHPTKSVNIQCGSCLRGVVV